MDIRAFRNPDGAYNDPATEIPLTANPFQQESQSQLLVSDAVDDSADGPDEGPGDRTHRIQLGGDVEISTIQIGAVTYPLGMKVLVKVRKRIEGKIIMVGDTNMSFAAVDRFKKVAKERLAQVGVDFDLTITSMDVPDGLDDEEVRYDGMGGFSINGYTGHYVHPDVKKLVDKAITDGKRGIITVFVVRNIMSPDRGFAMRRGWRHPSEMVYGDVAVISEQKTVNGHDFTLVHEVGHIITDAGHYGIADPEESDTDYYGEGIGHLFDHNLMRSGGTSGTNALDSSKRLYNLQQKMLVNELMVDP
ncbi:MAG: hypothetical protein KF712_05515 [Akkermansiaceae bacterium]|nr:hypothetical protein [Akkermansiaceae bacterium]